MTLPPFQRASQSSRLGSLAVAERAPSQLQQIVQYVKDHPGCTRSEIRRGTGYAINVVTARVNSAINNGSWDGHKYTRPELRRGPMRVCTVTNHLAQTVWPVESGARQVALL